MIPRNRVAGLESECLLGNPGSRLLHHAGICIHPRHDLQQRLAILLNFDGDRIDHSFEDLRVGMPTHGREQIKRCRRPGQVVIEVGRNRL